MKARYRGNPRDSSVFVCEDHTADYDIPENVVVKSLLDVIHRTLQEAEGYLNADYEWVSQTWKGNEELIAEFQRIVERNVHILRIREPKVNEPTDRMLSQAEQARQDVYRDAASLVRERHRLHRGEQDAIKALLDQTAIMPDDMSKLYELYVLFQMVGTLEQLVDASPVFKTIASERQELVRMDGEPEVVLYHDSTPDDPAVDFIPVVGDAETQSRSDIVQQESMQIASEYFKEHSFHDATGRPDVLILKVRHGSEEPANYLITEVKYSSNRKTVRRGIKETIEYLAFLRLGGEYVFEDGNGDPTFGDGWNGLLVTLDLPEETQSVAEQRRNSNSMKILQASEIDDHLEEILEQVLVRSVTPT